MSTKLSSRERFPELYAPPSTHTDPYKRTRKVPMRVLCLGLSRTGTASLWTALKELGFVDCYHMLSIFQNPPDADMWTEAVNAKYHGKGKPFEKEDWDRLLGDCQAVCDAPCTSFSEELISAYPDAKVIWTIRDVDSWYNSMMKTIVPVQQPGHMLDYIGPFDSVLFSRFNAMRHAWWNGWLEGKDFEKVGKQKFQEQYETVRRLVPKERLLEYKVGEGWERLCKFLEVPVPSYDFPNINEQETFRDRIQVAISLAMQRIMMKVLPVLGGGVAVGVAAWLYHIK
ncbi:hypothetical protein N7G274_002342 [Stereocaulon virgatum]|uniref:P-loop containing nucleoside triphosphate hydrolase protein n=1 Tax=Stereocaulon virgatum TaxID=373712 RepID=A0ABR4AKQ2_9LECA